MGCGQCCGLVLLALFILVLPAALMKIEKFLPEAAQHIVKDAVIGTMNSTMDFEVRDLKDVQSWAQDGPLKEAPGPCRMVFWMQHNSASDEIGDFSWSEFNAEERTTTVYLWGHPWSWLHNWDGFRSFLVNVAYRVNYRFDWNEDFSKARIQYCMITNRFCLPYWVFDFTMERDPNDPDTYIRRSWILGEEYPNYPGRVLIHSDGTFVKKNFDLMMTDVPCHSQGVPDGTPCGKYPQMVRTDTAL